MRKVMKCMMSRAYVHYKSWERLHCVFFALFLGFFTVDMKVSCEFLKFSVV